MRTVGSRKRATADHASTDAQTTDATVTEVRDVLELMVAACCPLGGGANYMSAAVDRIAKRSHSIPDVHHLAPLAHLSRADGVERLEIGSGITASGGACRALTACG